MRARVREARRPAFAYCTLRKAAGGCGCGRGDWVGTVSAYLGTRLRYLLLLWVARCSAVQCGAVLDWAGSVVLVRCGRVRVRVLTLVWLHGPARRAVRSAREDVYRDLLTLHCSCAVACPHTSRYLLMYQRSTISAAAIPLGLSLTLSRAPPHPPPRQQAASASKLPTPTTPRKAHGPSAPRTPQQTQKQKRKNKPYYGPFSKHHYARTTHARRHRPRPPRRTLLSSYSYSCTLLCPCPYLIHPTPYPSLRPQPYPSHPLLHGRNNNEGATRKEFRARPPRGRSNRHAQPQPLFPILFLARGRASEFRILRRASLMILVDLVHGGKIRGYCS
ncbi:uncharacterized protein K452DRAFT_88817 [Aplosporella prunicola CBS 121167]|uniref:Uncharacterized protein n=1 Tax=Aplosporella prunicola CBS 121167 TaxID=1176127 RepID=A0A6A6B5R9_9PEZI|nr:uncharacterized protein K452DRAFT_88817 [Aplosporella prunicola CBS 121167]KAF2138594.1 hypothetical protein K452DRAFT_88817 [Aplosporella prunicola CBS 121167]